MSKAGGDVGMADGVAMLKNMLASIVKMIESRMLSVCFNAECCVGNM